MKPILVCVHIYYKELWPELRGLIANIEAANMPYEMFITTPHHDNDWIEQLKHDQPLATIITVPNKGFDIAPFIDVINRIDLARYSYVIKLHTKRDIPYTSGTLRDLRGAAWRDSLTTILASPEVFTAYLQCFENDATIGMQSDYHCILPFEHDIDRKAASLLKCYIQSKGWLPIEQLVYSRAHPEQEQNLNIVAARVTTDKAKQFHNFISWLRKQKFDNGRFVAGTMFIARAQIFKQIQDLHLSYDDFSSVCTSGSGGTFAHMLERFIGYIVYAEGLRVTDGLKPEVDICHYWFDIDVYEEKRKKIKRFFFERSYTKHNRLVLRVFRQRIFLSPWKGKTRKETTHYKPYIKGTFHNKRIQHTTCIRSR